MFALCWLHPVLAVKAPADGNGSEALSADPGSQKPLAAELALGIHSLCSDNPNRVLV